MKEERVDGSVKEDQNRLTNLLPNLQDFPTSSGTTSCPSPRQPGTFCLKSNPFYPEPSIPTPLPPHTFINVTVSLFHLFICPIILFDDRDAV